MSNASKYPSNSSQPSWQDLVKHPHLLFAFGLGSGLAPKAPGTVGTLAAAPLVWLMLYTDVLVYWALCLLFSLIGIWLCDKASRTLNTHDHGGIVWDEWVGLMIIMGFIPHTMAGMVVGFVLFRLFDIIKPWPVSWLDQHIDGGLGIMVDDIAAALMGAALFILLSYVCPNCWAWLN